MADIIATRQHKILQKRNKQISHNLMAAQGGLDYIEARLSRFPSESDVSWAGSSVALSGTNVIGRKDRAFCINYARRIVTKINQYVFGSDIVRSGIDPKFEQDTSKTGISINAFMQEVSSTYTAGQWCWISVDRGAPQIDPTTGRPAPRSIAQRESAGDRVFWMLWQANEVVDWCFDAGGKLKWLITEQEVYDNSNYNVEATNKKIRTIWEPGKITRIMLNEEDSEKIESSEESSLSINEIPFVLVGLPSKTPWWFDDVERVQASLLDLESAHNENLIHSVYPQLVMPIGIIENIMRLTEMSGLAGYTKALEMMRGLNYPILEPTEASGLTRYLTPAAGDLKAIPDEILRRRKELMQIVGLAMANPETNQVQSANSKAWDNLDPSNTMRTRAIMLEEAETKAVALSKKIDSQFPEYKPEYPRQFDIPEPGQDIATIVQLGNMQLPESGQRELMKASMKLLGAIVSIPKTRMQEIMSDIDKMDIKELVPQMDSLMQNLAPAAPLDVNPDASID